MASGKSYKWGGRYVKLHSVFKSNDVLTIVVMFLDAFCPYLIVYIKNSPKYLIFTNLTLCRCCCFWGLMCIVPLFSEQFLNMSSDGMCCIFKEVFKWYIPLSLWGHQIILFLGVIVHRQDWILLNVSVCWGEVCILAILSLAKNNRGRECKGCVSFFWYQ